MSLRNWTALSAVVLVFAFSQLAAAQNPAPVAPKNAAQPNTETTWRDVLVELQQLRSEVQTLQSNVSGIQQQMDAVQVGFEKQLDINAKLQTQFDELNDKFIKIAQGESADGSTIASKFMGSIQDDPKLASDFQKVVQGKVIFDNQTGEAQRIFINGAEWEVITGRSSMLVPYGRVTFHTRATNDGTLTQFNVDNWTKNGDQFVLNVPLQPTPQADR